MNRPGAIVAPLDRYPILELQVDSPVLTEQLGSKPKFWFRIAGDKRPWLFKYAREGTGEHWAEKIAAEVAVKMKLRAAHVELAEFDGKPGAASRSFVPESQGYDLVHGDELLAGHVIGYDRDKVFRHSDHSISNIVKALEAVFPDDVRRHIQLTNFAGLMVLDALIGNTDRHHQNWGILHRVNADGAVQRELSPSFDHASSLGRNVSSAERGRRLKEGTVLAYARRGRGGIYWRSTDTRGANPLGLVEQAAKAWPLFFESWLSAVGTITEQDFETIVQKVPDQSMDALQKEFCICLLLATWSELKKIPL